MSGAPQNCFLLSANFKAKKKWAQRNLTKQGENIEISSILTLFHFLVFNKNELSLFIGQLKSKQAFDLKINWEWNDEVKNRFQVRYSIREIEKTEIQTRSTHWSCHNSSIVSVQLSHCYFSQLPVDKMKELNEPSTSNNRKQTQYRDIACW